MACGCCGRPSCNNSCLVKQNNCNDSCVRMFWVDGTACTIGIEHEGCTTTFPLAEGVQACETDTTLRLEKRDGTCNAALVYEAERHTDEICVCDIIDAAITEDDECVAEIDEDGNIGGFLTKDCNGCLKTCKIPIMSANSGTVNYVRDSVPNDPDFPYYYGIYNDKINLKLAQNFPEFFGKYDLEVQVNYGVQAVRPDKGVNVNMQSIVVPAIEGSKPDIEMEASILQGPVLTGATVSAATGNILGIPWGTLSLRSTFNFVVPKGKEAYLHHELRYRSIKSFPGGVNDGLDMPGGPSRPDGYQVSPLDGQQVPENIAADLDKLEWNASRLNALQVIVRPTVMTSNKQPAKDTPRAKLDAPVDLYKQPWNK